MQILLFILFGMHLISTRTVSNIHSIFHILSDVTNEIINKGAHSGKNEKIRGVRDGNIEFMQMLLLRREDENFESKKREKCKTELDEERG